MHLRIKREADKSQETPKELQLNCVQVSKFYIPDHKGKSTPVQPVFIDIYKVIKQQLALFFGKMSFKFFCPFKNQIVWGF